MSEVPSTGPVRDDETPANRIARRVTWGLFALIMVVFVVMLFRPNA